MKQLASVIPVLAVMFATGYATGRHDVGVTAPADSYEALASVEAPPAWHPPVPGYALDLPPGHPAVPGQALVLPPGHPRLWQSYPQMPQGLGRLPPGHPPIADEGSGCAPDVLDHGDAGTIHDQIVVHAQEPLST
jgi:hypothetical protein